MGVACGPGGRARGPFREAKSSRQSISLSMPPHPPRREGRDLVAIDASAPGLLSGWRRRQAPGPPAAQQPGHPLLAQAVAVALMLMT